MDEVAKRFEAARQANLAEFGNHWRMEKCLLCGEEFGTRPFQTTLPTWIKERGQFGSRRCVYNHTICYYCTFKWHENMLRILKPKIKKPFLQLVTYWANTEGFKSLGGWEEVDDETGDHSTRFADCSEGIE